MSLLGTAVTFKPSISTLMEHDGKRGTITGLVTDYATPTFAVLLVDGTEVEALGDELNDPETGEWLWAGSEVVLGIGGAYPVNVTKPWADFMAAQGLTWEPSWGSWESIESGS